ncbi:MAG: tripartite tricarboxylate transporter TctB family protein [Burkholderiaceae bacterium]
MSDRILGGVCVVAAAGMAWAAHGYAAAISYEPVGPRAFPLLLSALMAIGGMWLVIKPAARGGAVDFGHVRRIGLSALAVIVYCLLFQSLGFTLATALMAVPVGMAFGGSWWKSLLGGVGLGIGLFLLFDKLLDVVLPTGLLSFILGGR